MKVNPQHIALAIGGVNLNRDSKAIQMSQLALSKNAWPLNSGILSKRNGVAAMRVAILAGTNRFYNLDIGLLNPITGFAYVGHFHKYDTSSPTHQLIASSFDRETGSFINGQVLDLGRFKTDYDPVQFINYRGWCYAIVPGVEGCYILGPKYIKGKPQNQFVWTKATFLFDPAITANQSSQQIPVTPRLATVYKQRMCWANFGPGMGNWLLMADKATSTSLGQPTVTPLAMIVGTDVLSYNGRHIEVASLEGEDITAMSEVTLASMGSQIDSFLMLLTEKSCVFVSGAITQTNDTGATDPNGLLGNYQENRVNYECGCVGQNTVIHTPYGYFWVGRDDVWFMNDNTPDRIGTNIRPAILACPAQYRKHWSMAYANGCVVLQLITQSTVTAAGGSNGNITSYLHQYWLLDLRQGIPQVAEQAQWYGPMEIAAEDGDTLSFGPIKSIMESDGKERIIAMAYKTGSSLSQTYLVELFPGVGSGYDIIEDGAVSAVPWQANTTQSVGDIIRPVFSKANLQITPPVMGELFVCTAVTGNRQTNTTEPTWTTAGTPITDNNITWEAMNGSDVQALGICVRQRTGADYQVDIRSPDNALGEYIHEKLLRRVDVSVAPSNKVQLNVRAILNQQSEVDLGGITFGGASPELGVTELPTVIASAKSVSRTFRPSELTLVKGRQVQASITDSSAYIIDSTNDHFVATVYNESGATLRSSNQLIQVAIPQGAYATIDDILAALTVRLNLYISGLSSFGTFPASPWSSASAYSGGYPWFPRLTLAYTTWINAHNWPGFMFANSDVATTPGSTTIIGDDTTTLYLSRSKRLAALLGFDTTQSTVSGMTAAFGWTGVTPPADLTIWLCTNQAASPFNFDAIQLVQQKNSQRFDITSATMLLQPKSAIPLTSSDRS